MWITTSLRGIINALLKINVLKEGVHSGMGSGLVPGAFRIGRQLISRIEDEKSGEIVKDFQVQIPQERQEEGKATSELVQK